MEIIVDSRSDLEWDGWDVVRYKKNDNAQFDSNGVFKNGSWYNKIVFPLKDNGWSIPNKLGSVYV
jgi:hypothetical protein